MDGKGINLATDAPSFPAEENRTDLTIQIIISEDILNVVKPSLMMVGRDGRPVQRARRRFSVRESHKQIRA